jgi:DNA-directed RNA polymerase subunit RPC12/RpoP
MKKNRSITIGESNTTCRKCGGRVVIKTHPNLDKVSKQKQYFSQWEYCLKCKAVWFNPEFLVINYTSLKQQSYNQIQEYIEEMDSLFKNL